MAKIIIFNIIRFIVLLILQVAVLKNFGYYNMAVVYPYILIIFLLPIGIPNALLYILAFLTGLSLDAFYDSIGVHAAACVVLAFYRIFFHNITIEIEEKNSFNTPSWGNRGFKWYSTYILLGTFIHHLVLFLIESFSFKNFVPTLISITLSTLVSCTAIFIISLLTYHKKTRVLSN